VYREFAMRLLKQSMLCGALAVCSTGFAAPAQAAEYIGSYSGNDCGGKDKETGAGGGFDNCYATQNGVQQGLPEGVAGTPAIVKYEGVPVGSVNDISSKFPSITGSEISVLYDALTNTLSFNYTPGPNDPEIHYYSIKQSNGYALFYDANAILSGSWDLDAFFPDNPGYSHITFYDTTSGGGTGGEGGGAVPEPSTWAMMLLGFGGMGLAMRRRRRTRELMKQMA
jgi:hypothetical protein